MSVYTTIHKTQLREFLGNYSVGELIKFSGIEAGVENTNYFVSTQKGEFVLTIYEDLTPNELPFFLDLMQHLNSHKVPTASPVSNNSNTLLGTIANKPAALIERLAGSNVMQPTTKHCSIIGEAVAKMHLAGQSYHARGCRENNRADELEKLKPKAVFDSLSKENVRLLQQEIAHYNLFDWSKLPQGIVHSDLFRDNCLFYTESGEDKLSGVIDFYYACNDALLYDLAVITNDWCFNKSGELDPQRYSALLKAYHSVRPIQTIEKQQWSGLLRIAALHFWGFRLLFNLYPREGESVLSKDANEFKIKTQWHLANQASVEEVINTL